MPTSEEVAWQLYAGLGARDRRAVDAWRDLGNDLVTSLLNAGVLSPSQPRRVPADDVADFSRRMLGTDPAFVLQRTAEHEAAHAVVARALGLRGVEVTISDDGRSGATRYERVSGEVTAVVAAAADVWLHEFRAVVFPAGDADGCREDYRLLVRSTDGDHGVREARRRARMILAERRAEVLEMARLLARTRQWKGA